MALVSVDNLGQVGIITDQHAHKLPPNVWTNGKNVRFEHGEVKRVAGHASLVTLNGQIRWAIPLQYGSFSYWITASNTKIYSWDGTTNNTLATVTGNDDALWNGGVFAGIAILNNGVDYPQFWVPGAPTAEFLSGWDTGWKAQIIRPYKNLLIAMDLTESGERYGSKYRWSDVTDPGSLPDWTIDATTLAGSDVLEETQGYIVDGEALRDYFIIYKEDACFTLQFVGGNAVIANRMLLKTRGALTQRCAKEFYGRHCVLSNGDVFVHDGQNAESIADGFIRRTIFDNIDAETYVNSYVAPNFTNNEMWICYPESGNTYPNKAAIWNWKDNTWGFRDLPNASHIAYGVIPSTESRLIDDQNDLIDSYTQTIDQRLYNPADRKNVMIAPLTAGLTPSTTLTPSTSLTPSAGTSGLFSLDDGWTFSGSNVTAFVERRGLKPEQGDGVFHLRAVYPRGATGPLTIKVGKHDSPGATVSWEEPVTYTVGGSDDKVDVRVTGRYFAINVQFDEDGPGELQGMDFDIVKVGAR